MKIIDKLNEIHGKVVKRFVILGFPFQNKQKGQGVQCSYSAAGVDL